MLRYLAALAAGSRLRRSWKRDNGIQATDVQKFSQELLANGATTIYFSIATVATADSSKAALFKFRAFNENNEQIPIPGLPRSERVGTYHYLSPALPTKPAVTTLKVTPPPGASRIEVEGLNWDKYNRTYVLGDVLIGNENRAVELSNKLGLPITMRASELEEVRQIPETAATAEVLIKHKAGEIPSSGPVTVQFFDVNDQELLGPSDLPQHPKHGAHFTLKSDANEIRETETAIDVPRGARKIRLKGLDWGGKTATILEEPRIHFQPNTKSEIASFLQLIPAHEKLVILDTTAPPLGHETLALRPNNLTIGYQALGVWVIFIPFGTLQGFPEQPYANVMQIPREQYPNLIAALARYRSPENSVYICSSFPNFETIASSTLLKQLGWKTVYECRDDMEEFNRVGYSKWYTQELERYYLDIADISVAVSPALAEKLEDMTARPVSVRVIPNGVAKSTAEAAVELRSDYARQERESTNVLGYVGHLTDSWFNWPAVIEAAERLPHYTFEIVGHGIPENLTLPGNIHYLGPKNHEEIKEIVSRWKVGIIPFIDSPLTRSVDPNKIYEYFAWGLRCVTTQMGSVQDYPSTWVYSGNDAFVDALLEAMESPLLDDELAHLRSFVERTTWHRRAQQMHDILFGGNQIPEV